MCSAMTDDRRTKQGATRGEDPREIDRERTTHEAVEQFEAQDGMVHSQPRVRGLGTSSDAPGRDIDDLADDPEVPELREQS